MTVFTVADRLSTRGRNAEAAIEAHLELAREMLDAALAAAPSRRSCAATSWRASSACAARRSGACSAQLAEDQYAGAVTTREDALARARELLAKTTEMPG